MKHSIAILIPWFGDWPEWIDFFVESCRSNSSIDWILLGDAEPPTNRASNVRHVRIAFADYCELLSQKLEVRFPTGEPYKLCDVRPALPHVHADLVRGYDFVGFGDIDVIYGDVRSFYDDETLGSYDLLSSHADRVSGHLCLMRNREDVITAFRRVPDWRKALEDQEYLNFDERAFFRLFRGRKSRLLEGLGYRPFRTLFREAYSTPAVTERMRWFWRDGRLTNEYYPHHPFMYLHFMSWHSSRWYASQTHVAPGTPAPWSRLERIVRMDWRDARRDGFMISPNGIEPIEQRPYP
jgi:hypothetical protein